MALRAFPETIHVNEPGTILNPTQGEIAASRNQKLPSPSEIAADKQPYRPEPGNGQQDTHCVGDPLKPGAAADRSFPSQRNGLRRGRFCDRRPSRYGCGCLSFAPLRFPETKGHAMSKHHDIYMRVSTKRQDTACQEPWAPFPTSRLGLRQHTRGHQPVFGSGHRVHLPQTCHHLAPTARRGYDHGAGHAASVAERRRQLLYSTDPKRGGWAEHAFDFSSSLSHAECDYAIACHMPKSHLRGQASQRHGPLPDLPNTGGGTRRQEGWRGRDAGLGLRRVPGTGGGPARAR